MAALVLVTTRRASSSRTEPREEPTADEEVILAGGATVHAPAGPARSAWSPSSEVVSQDHTVPDLTALGRSVVVGLGDTTPGEWSSCERIRVAAVDQATADELGAAWRERSSVIIEFTPGLGLDDPEEAANKSDGISDAASRRIVAVS